MLERFPSELYIGGEWRAASGGGHACRSRTPRPASRSSRSPTPQAEDALAALAAAPDAQAEWARTAPRERGEILRRAYEAIVARADELALLMTLEMGKALAESRAEIAYAAEFFRWFSEEAVRIHGRYMVNTDRQGTHPHDAPAGRARACSSRPGTSRRRWAPARSPRRSPPAARWWSSPPSRRRCRCSRWPRSSSEAGLPGGVLNVITATRSGAVIEPLHARTRARASCRSPAPPRSDAR